MSIGVAVLCVAGVAALAAARFSVWPARTRRAWWVALVATELGHVWSALAGLAVAGAIWAAVRDGDAAAVVVWVAAAAPALLAMFFFARPAWCAWRGARSWEAELDALFGAQAGGDERLWSWRRLWRAPRVAARGAPETHEVVGADGARLPLDFFRARGLAGAAPLVVMVHGGGWDGGERGQLAAVHRWLAERGVAVAAISYRLAPAHGWPAQRDDLLAALAWLRENSARLGTDPARVTLAGRSAGAQIAAATAYAARPPGVRAVVALYGVHDLEFVWSIRSERDALNSDRLMRQFMGGGPEGREELYRSASAERLVHADAPPTVIVHGALDELVWCRHSERLAAALRAAGARCVFARLPWATHAGDANPHGPAGQIITGALLRAARGR